MTKITNKWWVVILLMIIVLVGAIFINSSKETDDASVLENTIDIDNGDQKINWDMYPTTDIELSESLEIEKAGTYHLTGSILDGSITINATNTFVRLILDNVTIVSSNGPAINCTDGQDLVIELVGKNYLEDSDNYSNMNDEDITGTIYSKADLTFTGDGELNITSNYQDAIVGKDDVKFRSGSYEINAKDDAIRGKDSVYIVSGNYNITAGADVIKTTNDTEPKKGFVLVEGGNFDLTAGAKGIKATTTLLFYGGEFAIESYDDTIHSDNYIGITSGTFRIMSGDDGIHANREIIIDGGEINVIEAYEGIEAQKITINNGKISATTLDDGINAGGGADNSSVNRKNPGAFDADENSVLTINDGDIYINSSGDGIDSNGYLYIKGGKVIVDGPTNNGNGALDSGMGIYMDGGEVIAIGASGMAANLGSKSSVNNISVYLDENQTDNTKITIKNSSEEIILEHTSAKSFNHIAAGTSNFKTGETYTLYLDDQLAYEFTIFDVTTTIGNSNNNFSAPPAQR